MVSLYIKMFTNRTRKPKYNGPLMLLLSRMRSANIQLNYFLTVQWTVAKPKHIPVLYVYRNHPLIPHARGAVLTPFLKSSPRWSCYECCPFQQNPRPLRASIHLLPWTSGSTMEPRGRGVMVIVVGLKSFTLHCQKSQVKQFAGNNWWENKSARLYSLVLSAYLTCGRSDPGSLS